MTTKDENLRDRKKTIYCNPHLIIDLLGWHKAPEGTYFALPIVDEIPEDVTILSVFPSTERNAIGMVLAHPSWDIIELGTKPPQLKGLYDVERRVVQKGNEE